MNDAELIAAVRFKRDLEAAIDAGWARLIEHWRNGGPHPSTHDCWHRRPAWVDRELAR